jgi:hypothetical protein
VDPASELVADFDAVMAEVIAFAESCSDVDWRTTCPNEQRTVGVLFDHIAVGNPEVVRWIDEFLAGRPVQITREILTASNAAHAQEVEGRPRAQTLADLKHSAARTSAFLGALTDAQLSTKNEFGWAGTQDVAWVASAAVRHPRGHLKSVREALGR